MKIPRASLGCILLAGCLICGCATGRETALPRYAPVQKDEVAETSAFSDWVGKFLVTAVVDGFFNLLASK